MIEFKNITKKYIDANKKVDALQDINLKIKKGEIVGIIGKSGAGKSTILELLSCISIPDSGSINVWDKDITKLYSRELKEYQKQLGIVFQDYNLLSNVKVIDNVILPLKIHTKTKIDMKDAIRLLEYVGLENEKNSYIQQLSGGQKQRVAIARALITNPKILLLDEITSALDYESANNIIELLKRINQELGITIIFVSHDLLSVKNLCEKVFVLDNGKIIDSLIIRSNRSNLNYQDILIGNNDV